jgi:hypothetical protein
MFVRCVDERMRIAAGGRPRVDAELDGEVDHFAERRDVAAGAELERADLLRLRLVELCAAG